MPRLCPSPTLLHLAVVGAVLGGCAPNPTAADVHQRDEVQTLDDTPGGTDTGIVLIEQLSVDDQDMVITSIDEDEPAQSWEIDIGADRYVTFRMFGPVDFRWTVLAPDGLPLDPYRDGVDEVTHGKTGPQGGTFELTLELPAGQSTADVELSITSEPL